MRIFEQTKKRTVLEKNMKRFISERPHSLNWFFNTSRLAVYKRVGFAEPAGALVIVPRPWGHL